MIGWHSKLEDVLDLAKLRKNVFFWIVFFVVTISAYVYSPQIDRFFDYSINRMTSLVDTDIYDSVYDALYQPEGCLGYIVWALVSIVFVIVALILAVILGIAFIIIELFLFFSKFLLEVFIFPVLLGLIVASCSYVLVEKVFFAFLYFVVGIFFDLFPRKKTIEHLPISEVELMSKDKKFTDFDAGVKDLKAQSTTSNALSDNLNNLVEVVFSDLKKDHPEGLVTAYWGKVKLKARIEYYLTQRDLLDSANKIMDSITSIIESKIKQDEALVRQNGAKERFERQQKWKDEQQAAEHKRKLKEINVEEVELEVRKAAAGLKIREFGAAGVEEPKEEQKPSLEEKWKRVTDESIKRINLENDSREARTKATMNRKKQTVEEMKRTGVLDELITMIENRFDAEIRKIWS